MAFRIPPGGFAGFAQMTPASRLALAPATPSKPGPRRGRSRSAGAARSATRKRRGTGARKKAGKRALKFGSPAWRKKYMKARGRKKA